MKIFIKSLILVLLIFSLVKIEAAKKVKKINFKKSIEINKNNLKIDGKKNIKANCYEDKKNKQAFALLKIDFDTEIPFYCENDYLGGVFLEAKTNDTNNSNSIMLFQQESDAGELWDRRSWFIKNNDKVELITITLGSYHSEEEGIVSDKRDCKMSYNAYQWNEKKKRFEVVEKKLNNKFWISKFSIPIHVEDLCLNKQGQWKQ